MKFFTGVKIAQSFVTAAVLCAGGCAGTHHGPAASIVKSPYGNAVLKLPFNRDNKIGTKKTIPDRESHFNTLTSSSASAGYFIGPVQAEARYTQFNADGQTYEIPKRKWVRIPGEKGRWVNYTEIINISSDTKHYDVIAGRRFSSAGDTSYGLLYLMGRKMTFDTEYEDTSVRGFGYMGGYSGFYSFGINFPIELVLCHDLYFGVYQFTDMKTTAASPIDKKLTLAAGGSFGLGVQYEPWFLSALLKVTPVLDMVNYEAAFDYTAKGQNYSFINNANMRAMGASVGVEIKWCFDFNGNNR